MRFRFDRKKYLLYPEDDFVDKWNSYITFVLIFTSLVAPARLAFVQKDDILWFWINNLIDLMFFFDILIIFNSAVINEDDYSIIDDRKEVACHYVSGWFLIDLLSIIPFDLILSSGSGNMNNMMKLMRIGRIYKLVKLTRLLKMLKLIKDRSKILKIVNETMKIGVGFERLFFFVMMFIMMSHIVSCLWVLAATIYDSTDGTWI